MMQKSMTFRQPDCPVNAPFLKACTDICLDVKIDQFKTTYVRLTQKNALSELSSMVQPFTQFNLVGYPD